jgi:membrane protein required for colicin V production
MHWLDITLLVVLTLGALLGARSGLLWQVARLVTFGVAFYVSIFYHEQLADLLGSYVTGASPFVLSALAYVGSFLGIYLVLFAITALLERVLKASKLKGLDRLLGAGFGALKATLLAGAVLMGLALLASPQTDAAMAESKLAPVLLQGMQAATVAVPQEYKDQFNASLERIREEGLKRANEVSDAAARKALEEQLRSALPAPAEKAAPNAAPSR